MDSSRGRVGTKFAREQGDSTASKLAPTINDQYLLRTHALAGNREPFNLLVTDRPANFSTGIFADSTG